MKTVQFSVIISLSVAVFNFYVLMQFKFKWRCVHYVDGIKNPDSYIENICLKLAYVKYEKSDKDFLFSLSAK